MIYSIGQVSKALNISVQAIRLYQKKHLIVATEVDEETGYRYFNEEEMGKIWRIKVLQSAGFHLAEIKALEALALEDIQEIIKDKRKQLETEIRIKNMSLAYLDRQVEAIEMFESEAQISVKYIKRRHGQAFASDVQTTIFQHLIDLSHIEGDFGINQEVSYLPSRRMSVIGETVVFKDLFAIYLDDRQGHDIQEEGHYICCYCKEGMDVKAVYKAMRAYAKKNGYTLRGDAIERILINDNLVNQSKYNLFEVQMAIGKA